MCLACEMDAWWVTEMEVGGLPLPAGERSTASEAKTAGEGLLSSTSAESPSPGALRAADLSPTGRGEAPRRGEVKATPSVFRCEETRSE
jgi:hypothetical protein